EVRDHGNRPQRPPGGCGCGVAQEHVYAKAAHQPGRGTPRDITSADDQDSLHIARIISRKMPFKISLQPGGQEFEAAADQTILDAALEDGLLLPYGCRDGARGACKGQVLSGTVDYGGLSETALTDADRAAGRALFCRAMARSDLVLEARSVTRAGDIPVKKLPCRVQ